MSRKRSKMRTTQLMLSALITAALISAPAGVYAKAPVATAQAELQAGTPAGPVDPAEVQAFADQFFARPEIASTLAGALAVVVKDDQILLNKGYGYADVASKKPIDPNTTLFRMASITKSVTSTAIMQLAEQGKLDIKKDISTYIPDIPISNKTGVPVTIENLMTHTTGFDFTDSAEMPITGSSTADGDVAISDFLKANAPAVVRKPGEAYRYDNYAFTLQGYIVEKVSGMPFEQYVADHIFKPLQMSHANMRMTKDVIANLATGYNVDKQPLDAYPLVPTIAPEGGMFASGSDMANFLIAHVNDGQFGDTRILEEKMAEQMHDIHVSLGDDLPIVSYGFESFLHQKHNGQLVIGKGGDLSGYHSWMWLLPEQNIGGLIITNSDLTVSVREQFFAAFMDHYYPKKQETKSYLQSSKQQLARFEGTYRGLRTPLMASQVTAAEGALIVKDSMGTHTLKQIGPLRFEDEIGAPAAFKEDETGNIAYLYYNSPDSFAEKMAEPAAYDDVPSDHPYADSIYFLRALKALDDDASTVFAPEQAMTRAEFVRIIARLSGLRPTNYPPVFSDLQGHPAAADVQTIVQLGGITGTSAQQFEPDRPITRQEAAVIIWRIAHNALGLPSVTASLSTAPAPWASEGVQNIVAAQLYGPEVTKDASGAVDYKPTAPMKKQEAAVLLTKFMKSLFGSV